MSYADEKRIAVLRLELRACWERSDYAAAARALSALRDAAAATDADHELVAEIGRWAFRLDVMAA